MTVRRSFLRRLKLRYVLFIALLLSGIGPLAISGLVLMKQSEAILQSAERDDLIHKADVLAREVNDSLVGVRRQLQQLGSALLMAPGPPLPASPMAERLGSPWVQGYLARFLRDNPDLLALRVLDLAGVGPTYDARLAPADREVLQSAFDEAKAGRRVPAYRFIGATPAHVPLAAMAVPVRDQASGVWLIAEVLVRLHPIEDALQRGAQPEVGAFLIDRQGHPLWSSGRGREAERAILGSEQVQQFKARPMSSITQIGYDAGGRHHELVAQISAVDESGWWVVVHRPLAAAFARVDQLVVNALISTAVLVVLAFLVAYLVAGGASRPIQRLAETTHEIAAGNFGRRVEVEGPGLELANLAEDFNRMSLNLESHLQQLRQAAQANRELFIGSLRAFVAAVDAKDPYTRGHSERVAAVSRTIARQLGLAEEVQHKVWIGALLHDVGKIGVEDQILRKSGVLTPEEYEQMKLHTVMGSDILSRIEQLREMVPAVRWHHESWNGRGYPDGLKGEQIPLMARIVAVADCFDAITTTRPYQQAYSLQFAVETITKLTGSRFDAKVVTAFLRAFEAGDVRAACEAVGGRYEDEQVQEPARAAAPR